MFESRENSVFTRILGIPLLVSMSLCASQHHDITRYVNLQSWLKPQTSLYTYNISEPEAALFTSFKANEYTAKEIITWFREEGLPMAVIAEIADVERKTVYAWLNGGPAKENNLKRLTSIRNFLSENKQDTNLRSLYRLWNREVNGHTLRTLFLQNNLNALVIKQTLKTLWPIAKKYMEAEKKVLPNTDIRKNPILSEISEVSIFPEIEK